jgi:hypothetical protein
MPGKPAMRQISLLIEADLLDAIDAIAAEESRSRARQIGVYLRRAVRDRQNRQTRQDTEQAAKARLRAL